MNFNMCVCGVLLFDLKNIQDITLLFLLFKYSLEGFFFYIKLLKNTFKFRFYYFLRYFTSRVKFSIYNEEILIKLD